MAVKILVVDKSIDTAMAFIGSLGQGEVDIVFVQHSDRAITNLRKTPYSLIIMGDKLANQSDTFDVGLELKQSNINRHTPVVCMGAHKSRQKKLVNLLRPYSYLVNMADPNDVEVCIKKIRERLVAPSLKAEKKG